MFRTTSRIALVFVALVATLALTPSLFAQAARGGAAKSPLDPFIGTWKLDRLKSTAAEISAALGHRA